MSDVEWVRAVKAARMLGVSRERVRQLIEAGKLLARREPKRVCWVRLEDVLRRAGKTEESPKDM